MEVEPLSLNQSLVAPEPISKPMNPWGAVTRLVFGPFAVEKILNGKLLITLYTERFQESSPLEPVLGGYGTTMLRISLAI